MYSKKQDWRNLFCPSMGSIDGCSRTSVERKGKTFVHFQVLNTEEEDSNDPGDSCPSDRETGISGPENQQRVAENGLIPVQDTEVIYENIKERLSSYDAQVVSIHRNDYSGVMSQARLRCFFICSNAMELKCGNANVKYAWYGASKNEVDRILSYGFGIPKNRRTHGHGIYLSPVDHPIESLQSSDSDEDGVRHTLLCRVILGKTEVVHPGSEQYNPSSAECDSGVDNLAFPKKYIIWCSRMNSHILPEFVVSFRASTISIGKSRKPKSDWMPFATLIAAVSKYIPADATQLITKLYRDYKNKMMTRYEMVQRVRHIAGDKLLKAVIKKYSGKGSSFLFN